MADATENAGTESAGYRRKMIGTVRSNKMDKTVVVEVVRYSRHRKYKKYMKTRERYQAHDAQNEYFTGDRVEIMAARPMSRKKRWVVTRLIAASADGALEDANQ